MKTLKTLAILLFLIVGNTNTFYGQCCAAHAGTNKTICCPGGCVVIGANPAVTDTCSKCDTVLYSWTPATGLNNSHLANPTACPTVKTVYTLHVYVYNKTTHDTCCKSTATMTVNVNSSCCKTTGINSTEPSGNFKIFPNPSNGEFVIDIGVAPKNATISIFDINGRLILQQKGITTSGIQKVDLSREPKGIYFIKVSDVTGDLYQQKIIIEWR